MAEEQDMVNELEAMGDGNVLPFQVETDIEFGEGVVEMPDGSIIQIGKRRFLKISIKKA